MKLKVPKSTLDKAIRSVSKAVPNKGIQPILNNILLENSNGHLVLNATDLDFSIEARIPSENEVPGSITLSARKLEEIVSKLEEDDVEINVDNSNQRTSLLCKGANFDLIGVSPEDFPKQNKPDSDSFLTISKERFARIVDMVQFSASRYDSSNILGGVYFGIRETTTPDDPTKTWVLDVAATDGNRLSSYEEPIDVDGTKFAKKEVVVPVKVVTDVQRILETSVSDDLQISFLNNQIIFKTEDRFIVSRLLDGVYPRYKQLIPKDQDKIAKVDRKHLLHCLERVAVMANEITNLVKLSFSFNALTIQSSNNDFGGAEDHIDTEYIGDSIEIYFNVKYLIEAIKAIDSDFVQISMLEPLNPVVIKPASEERFIHLAMPIKHKG